MIKNQCRCLATCHVSPVLVTCVRMLELVLACQTAKQADGSNSNIRAIKQQAAGVLQ